MTRDEIAAAMTTLGEPAYRARQIHDWIYAKRASSFDRMTNLPAPLRTRLAETFDLGRLKVAGVEASTDGTRKYLLDVKGGRIESVLIPEPSRNTFCISSQVGCALDCAFCLTARMGFGRHLKAGEIVSQVLLMLGEREADGLPVNIVFMGMGEPLHNYEEVMRAFRILTARDGVGISGRRVTVSTAGLVPGIRRLAEEEVRPRLAISLNGTTDEIRSRIMPINRKYPLRELLDAAAAFPLPPRGRLTFEYVMLEGINCSTEDARRLPALVKRHHLSVKVNLIPFNPGGEIGFSSPPIEAVRRFRDRLLAAGLPCSIRKNRGRDISAACGQLVGLGQRPVPGTE
jgi:23S rRNA (adenine2503-C2)-methyltransferase